MMRGKAIVWFAVMLILSCAALAGAADYFVDTTNGVDSPGRGTMTQPWKTINYALDHINGSQSTPHRVLVAQAVYVENVVCDAYESIYGGYSPSSWARDIALFSTTISGNNADSCVVLAEGCTVDGFVLSNGSRDYGGGVRCEDINATISNCRITLNAATTEGSAIYVNGGFVQIQNNTITNNTKSAVYVVNGGAGLQNNVISDTLSGPGISSDNATLTMSGDRVLRNAQRGLSLRFGTLNASRCIIGENAWSGIWHSGDATLIECVVHRNDINVGVSGDFNGGGIWTGNGALVLERSVVCQNTAPYRGGGFLKGGGTATIRDSILVANRSGWGHCAFFNGDATTLKNNFVVNNGVIDVEDLCHGGTPFISVNNSVLYNDAGYDAGCLHAGDVTMTNDILWGNGDDLNLTDVFGDPVIDTQLISHCNIEDGDRNQTDNNISVNPDFIGQIGSGTFTGLDYRPQDCRTAITDAAANYVGDALARRFLWVNDVAFYIESNTSKTLTVFGDVSRAASVGYSYTVQDYHLMQGSLCIDVGTGSGALDHDFEGDPRPTNGGLSLQVDIGADEYSDAPPPNDPPTTPTAVATLAVALTVPSVDPEGRNITYTVRWASGAGDTVVHAGCVSVRGVLCDVLTETDRLGSGKTWTVTVTPNDGNQNGPAAVVEIGPGGTTVRYDTNNDGKVDAADVVTLVNHLHGNIE